MDFKRRAVAYKENHTLSQLREAFGIPPETYYLWKRNLENGYYEKKIVRERRRKIDKEKLRQAVERNPDAYLRELAQMFACSASSVLRALRKLKITRKKNASHTARNPKKSVLSLENV